MVPLAFPVCYSFVMRGNDICPNLSPADRQRHQALLNNRNTPLKAACQAWIVLATADGCRTNEIMRRAKTSEPAVCHWQERYLD
jgi:hypothetical protein